MDLQFFYDAPNQFTEDQKLAQDKAKELFGNIDDIKTENFGDSVDYKSSACSSQAQKERDYQKRKELKTKGIAVSLSFSQRYIFFLSRGTKMPKTLHGLEILLPILAHPIDA